MKKYGAMLLALAMVLALAGCGKTAEQPKEQQKEQAKEQQKEQAKEQQKEQAKDDSKENTAKVETDQAATGNEAGFTEYPIFEDEEVGFMSVSAVYFQPVPMSNGNENIEGFNIHLECDIKALENKLGYGLGDWVPYLTVDYKVVGNNGKGDVAAEGTFMVMSASDGPHYGANIKLDKADTYAVTFTFHNPEENGYLLHTDAETGPGGSFDDYFKDGNLQITHEGWEYTPQEW